MRFGIRGWLVGAALWLGATAPAFASPSESGRLHGVVTREADGLGLPSVSVTLRSQTLPLLEVRSTSVDGAFKFEDLPAGLYSLEAKAEGFARATLSPILVVPGVPVTEHLVLAEDNPRAPAPAPRS